MSSILKPFPVPLSLLYYSLNIMGETQNATTTSEQRSNDVGPDMLA